MYFVCPICNTASWMPMVNGIMAQYENGQVVIPKTKLNKRQIKWNCKCLKEQQMKLKLKAEEREFFSSLMRPELKHINCFNY